MRLGTGTTSPLIAQVCLATLAEVRRLELARERTGYCQGSDKSVGSTVQLGWATVQIGHMMSRASNGCVAQSLTRERQRDSQGSLVFGQLTNCGVPRV